MPQFDFLNIFIIFVTFFSSFIFIETFSFYITKPLIVHQLYLITFEQVNKRFQYLLKK